MNKRNSVGLGVVILFWLSALLWSAKCVAELFAGQLQGADPIIAIIWCVAAVKWTKRYHDEKREEENDA